MKSILKMSAISAVCVIAGLMAPASAQTPTKAKFAADDAAYCSATFAWIIEFLAPSSLPEEAVVQTNIAFMMWNYELEMAMGGKTGEEDFRKYTTGALKTLAQKMPKPTNSEDGKTSQEDAQKIADFVMREAQACGGKLTNAYPEITKHPVLVDMQKRADAIRAQEADKPITLPQN